MAKKIKKGTKVEVNSRHHGLWGSTGRVIAIEQIRGRTYYKIQFTGGRARGDWHRVTAHALEIR